MRRRGVRGGLPSVAFARHAGLLVCWLGDWPQRLGLGERFSGGGTLGRIWRGVFDVRHWLGVQPAQVDAHAQIGVWVGLGPSGADTVGHLGPQRGLGLCRDAIWQTLVGELANRPRLGLRLGHVEHRHCGQADGGPR